MRGTTFYFYFALLSSLSFKDYFFLRFVLACNYCSMFQCLNFSQHHIFQMGHKFIYGLSTTLFLPCCGLWRIWDLHAFTTMVK